jgi:hypothetical protein
MYREHWDFDVVNEGEKRDELLRLWRLLRMVSPGDVHTGDVCVVRGADELPPDLRQAFLVSLPELRC